MLKKKVSNAVQAPSDLDVSKYLDQLDTIMTELADHVVMLTPAQRKSATKIRKGGDKIIPLLANAANRLGVTSASADPNEMVAQLALANALLPLLVRVRSLSEMISDTVINAHGKSWTIAGALYSSLVRLAKTNPSVASQLAPISPIFSRKKKTTETDESASDQTAETAPVATPVVTSTATVAPTHP